MKTNITFRKEVTIDLNEYYPSLPKRLREEIDNAIYELLGGTLKKKREAQARISTTGVKDAVLLRIKKGSNPRANTKTAAVLADLRRMNGDEFLRDDVMKICLQHKFSDNAIHNMIAHGHLEVVQ